MKLPFCDVSRKHFDSRSISKKSLLLQFKSYSMLFSNSFLMVHTMDCWFGKLDPVLGAELTTLKPRTSSALSMTHGCCGKVIV